MSGGAGKAGTAAVIGDGMWGCALARLLAANGNRVFLYSRDPARAREINERRTNEKYLGGVRLEEGIEAVTDPTLAADGADLVFLAVPSHAMRGFLREFGGCFNGGHRLVSCAKGIEIDSLKRMSEIIREETACRKIGALSGPNLAAEILEGQPAAAVVASKYEEVVRAVEDALAGDRMRVYGEADLTGVELGGALKNIIAIVCGVADGLGLGWNARGLVMTRGVVEIARLGVRLGASPATFNGLSGIGDLIATCSSPLSRNHTVGRLLSQGLTLDEILRDKVTTAEGVKTTRAARQLARSLNVEMPLTEAVHGLLYENADVKETLAQLMKRRRFYEKEDFQGGWL